MIIIIMASQLCCLYNGKNARCIRCTCARNNRPCFSCRPGCRGNCQNLSNRSSRPKYSNQTDNLSTRDDDSFSDEASSSDEAYSNAALPCSDFIHLLLPGEVDPLMDKAFGSTLSSATDISNKDSTRHKHWLAVTKQSRCHYHLPRGPFGRRYIDLHSEQIQYLPQASFPSYHLIVYNSVVLHSDKSARTGFDIRCTLNRK